MGFQGYPEISIAYASSNNGFADEVILTFIAEEGAKPVVESFQSKSDVRENEIIQSAIVKMIERAQVKTVKLSQP